MLDRAADTKNNANNAVIECLRKRVPIHFGGMSDPFLVPVSHQNVTTQLLGLLNAREYPTIISTKADIRALKEAISLILGKRHFAFQFSFSTFDERVASVIEPHAPSPSKRLEAAKLLLNNGNWVSCRLQPFFPVGSIDDMVNFISHTGFSHLTVEHFKLPHDRQLDTRFLSRALKVDIMDFFPSGLRVKRGREWEMPLHLRFGNACHFLKAGKRYRIPIGIGDNGLQHLGSTSCCCGIDKLAGFENWLKLNSAIAVRRASSTGLIRFSSIAGEWAPTRDISRMINSELRLVGCTNSIKNLIKRQWAENRQYSPGMFYGVRSTRTPDGYSYSLDWELLGGYHGKNQ